MFLRDVSSPFHHATHPVAGEFARLTTILSGLYLWHRLVRVVLSTVAGSGSPPAFGGVVVSGLVFGGTTIAGVLLFTIVYTDYRNSSLGLQLPSRSDLPMVGVAGVLPVVGVALTKLVGSLTGVPYNSLTQTAVSADTPLLPVAKVTGVAVIVGVPLFVIVCQILIQDSLRQAVDADKAIALTTLVAGFVLMSNTGGLTVVPDRGRLLGAVLFAFLIGFGPYVVDQFDPERRPAVAYGPAFVFVAFVVVSGVAAVDSIAGGLFILTHLAVLGVAAYSYDRTGSVLPPAVAYTTLELANSGVIYFFEAGMQSW